ncbi:hypothetical protein VTL71DRAFT_6936 [Oculimacula yallundae]|uniref:Major facilitator superfamily (MFS) profile domain-containing protein n=1 Tax=Oculimacula yallundae TaxID=86028 RepID=A0ABR4BV87_9HELO
MSSNSELMKLGSPAPITLDFLRVRRLASEPSIPQLQTRWYSPLEFGSLPRTPEPPIHMSKHLERKIHDVEVDSQLVGTIVLGSLDTGRRALRPQPSMDLNDPLNWSILQKFRTYLIICLFTFLASVNTSKFTFATTLLCEEFSKDPNIVTYLTAFNFVSSGVGSIFWVTLMRVLGKRLMILLALPIFVAANVWAAKTNDFNHLLATTVLSGFSSAAAGAPVATVVTDLFFVHERGAKLMVFTLWLSSGIFLGPLINAFIFQYSNWRVASESIAIASGALWIFTFLLFRETTYHKRDIYAPVSSYGSRTTFVGSLSLVRGLNKNQNCVHAILNCLTIFFYPSVLWSGLLIGIFFGLNTIVQLRSYNTFTESPYDYTIPFLGLFSISGFIGSLIAVPFGGKLIDMLSTRLTKCHHNTREPEYRLYPLIVPAIIGSMGILLFGFTIADEKPWIQPAIGHAMQGFGLTATSNIIVTYIVDTYVDHAAEALGVVFAFRGAVNAVAVLYGDKWIMYAGEKQAFGQMVGVQGFICMWVIIFLLCGKKVRAFTVRYGPVRTA